MRCPFAPSQWLSHDTATLGVPSAFSSPLNVLILNILNIWRGENRKPETPFTSVVAHVFLDSSEGASGFPSRHEWLRLCRNEKPVSTHASTETCSRRSNGHHGVWWRGFPIVMDVEVRLIGFPE